ncbi:MAG: hypothetical protein Q9160_008577 [Pyrenula sp. 1 TL-2023]
MIEGMINIRNSLSHTTIYLRMRGIHSEQTSLYPISGFPRSLIAEDVINGMSSAFVTKSHLLNSPSESRLDRRAELIKERRYGRLAVANDPKVTLAPDGEADGDHASKTPTKETRETTTGEAPGEEPPTEVASAENTDTRSTTKSASASAPIGRRSNSHTSSQTLVSRLSDGSASSAARNHISVADLRAQAQDSSSNRTTIKDGKKLTGNISALTLSGSNAFGLGLADSDFGSDESDGPPSDAEAEAELEEERPRV